MPYVPNAADATQPTEDKTVESAALEFRTLKVDVIRSLKFPSGESASYQGPLPTATNRAGRFLAFDSVTAQPIPGPLLTEWTITQAQITSISTVAGSIANVNTVAGSITSVNTVAGSIAGVNAIYANLAEILNADTQAANAAASASAAATSATNAANSATAAATSATSAASSASTATTQATAASNSATSAAGSASTATTQAAAASASATAANTSANNAASSANAAATSATNSANSATTATNAATSATNSAATATTQAGVATAQASAAATSATSASSSSTAAANSATNSANSATASASSASASAASAAAAATALDNFDDRYLGSKSTAPTLDNDGNALITGALYFNDGTVVLDNKGMWTYDGSQWIKASAASQAILVTYEYLATQGQTTFSGADANSLTLAYTAGSIVVTLNGVKLRPGNDYTATNGTSVVLLIGAAAGDDVVIDAFSTFDVANTYTKPEADAEFLRKANEDGVLVAAGTPANTLVTTTGGNVGIGTSSPGSPGLTVYRAGSSAISLNNAATGTAAGSGFQSQIGSSGEAYIWNYSNSFIAIGTNNTERFRIDSSGRVTMPYQPAFLAYPSATSVSVPSGVSTISGAFTAPVNIGSHFNTSTRRFTAPISGSYFFSACVATIGSTGTFDYLSSEIWVNGSRRIQGGWDGGGASYGKSSVSGVIYLNANEYVELACEASKAFSAQGGSAATIFSGYLIG